VEGLGKWQVNLLKQKNAAADDDDNNDDDDDDDIHVRDDMKWHISGKLHQSGVHKRLELQNCRISSFLALDRLGRTLQFGQ